MRATHIPRVSLEDVKVISTNTVADSGLDVGIVQALLEDNTCAPSISELVALTMQATPGET